MKKTLWTLATLAGGILTSNATLIASESFSTIDDPSGSTGQYDDGPGFNSSVHSDVLVGNTGFNSTNLWLSGTGSIRPSDDQTNGLTHALTAGSVANGAARFRTTTSVTRSAARELAAAPMVSANYYISGLVRINSNFSAAGEGLSMGMGDSYPGSANDFNTGFHLGVYSNASNELRLGAFGGGATFDLGAASLATNYMIVLGLTANAGGADSLNAWVAMDGDPLSQVLTGQSLETFSAVGDLDTLILQLNLGNTNNGWADEMRFGTEFTDVTVPEPSVVLLGGFGLLGLLRRRRSR